MQKYGLMLFALSVDLSRMWTRRILLTAVSLLSACSRKSAEGVVLRDDADEEDEYEPEPRRLVSVYNPTSKKTYLIDLNRMPTCDGLEPLPLPNGSDPFHERFQKANRSSRIDLPTWLIPPPGAKVTSTQHMTEMVLSKSRAIKAVTVTYQTSGAIQHYKKIGLQQGYVINREGVLMGMENLGLISPDGLQQIDVQGYPKEGTSVHYSRERRGAFHFDPLANFPTLDLDHFDASDESLYLVDHSTGQRFQLRKEVVETEDESPRDIKIDPAQLPAWLSRFPGALVESSHGALHVNGQTHHQQDSERLSTFAPYDKVVAFYRNLIEGQKDLRPTGKIAGDAFRRSSRRFISLAYESENQLYSIGISDAVHHTEIDIAIIRKRHQN